MTITENSESQKSQTEPGRALSSPLVAALEQAWAAIQTRHTDLPNVVIVLASGSVGAPRVALKLGHFAAMRWTHAQPAAEQNGRPTGTGGGRAVLPEVSAVRVWPWARSSAAPPKPSRPPPPTPRSRPGPTPAPISTAPGVPTGGTTPPTTGPPTTTSTATPSTPPTATSDHPRDHPPSGRGPERATAGRVLDLPARSIPSRTHRWEHTAMTHFPRPVSSSTTPSVALYAEHPDLPAPAGHLFASACWLVARHPLLHQLACRLPGVVDPDSDVLPWVLADAFAELDTHAAAWRDYEHRHPAPSGYTEEDEARYEAWLDAGPQPSPAAEALGVMSRTEVARIRLVATFSDQEPVAFNVPMLDGFDPAGDALVRDWMTAVQAYRGDPFPIRHVRTGHD